MKTVGKIVVSEQNTFEANRSRSPQRKSAARKHSECSSSNGSHEDYSNAKRRSDDDDDDDECVSSEAEVIKLGSNKLSKQVDDQRFTIETTVKVQKYSDKKKARKDDNEPSPKMKRKKSTKSNNDSLNC